MENVLKKVAIPEEVLSFYKDLLQFQAEYSKKAVTVPAKVTKEIDECLSQGAPLINLVKLPINKKEFQKMVRDLTKVFKEHRPNMVTELDNLKKVLLASNLDYKGIINNIIWQEEKKIAQFVEEHSLDGNLFAVFMVNLVKPITVRSVNGLKDLIDNEKWYKGYCPICGWDPLMARISQNDHQRFLHCSLCSYEWLFKRLECPYCGHNEPTDQKYFTVEGDEAHQVAVCAKCKSYVKTIDENKAISGTNLVIDDVKTLYLDILAEKEGYSKGSLANKKQN